MNPDQLIASLNAINVGELDVLRAKLEEARAACAEAGHDDLAGLLEESLAALSRGDLKTYRKRIGTVVARLGHLR